jgi:hypothetical protein
MSFRKLILGIGLSTAMAGTLGLAQQNASFAEGDRIFTLSGGGTSDNDFDSNTASIQLGLGQFLNDFLAAGVRQDLSVANLSDSNDWNASTRLGLDYYPVTGRTAPYVGANVGYVYGDAIRNQFIAGPNVGVRHFINDTTFLTLGVEYQVLFKDSDEAQDTYKDGRFVYELGMGVKW